MPTSAPQSPPLREKPSDVQVALLDERMSNLKERVDEGHSTIGKAIDGVADKIERLGDDIKKTYATKIELLKVEEKVKGLQSVQTWVVKLIIGGLLTAGMTILVKGGLHP